MAGTGVRFTVIETDDETKVDYGQGQYIIEDGSAVYYDPTTGSTVSDRIKIGSADIDELKRQLSKVYKSKGSCSSLPTQNNQIGDVWNLLELIRAGSIQLQATKNETIIVPTSRMTYSSEYREGNYTHTFSILFLYREFPEIYDSNYSLKTSGLFWDTNKVSITMEGISFDSIPYEHFHISPEEDGYKIVFQEFSQSAVSEFQRVASEERTVTQIKIPHENRTDFPSGSNVVWVEPGYWDVLSNIVDLSGYATKAYVNNLVGTINTDIEDVLTGGV